MDLPFINWMLLIMAGLSVMGPLSYFFTEGILIWVIIDIIVVWMDYYAEPDNDADLSFMWILTIIFYFMTLTPTLGIPFVGACIAFPLWGIAAIMLNDEGQYVTI